MKNEVKNRVLKKTVFSIVFAFVLSGCSKFPGHEGINFRDDKLGKSVALVQFEDKLLDFLKIYASTFNTADPVYDWTQSMADNPNYVSAGSRATKRGDGILYIYEYSGDISNSISSERYFYIFLKVSKKASMTLYSWDYWYSAAGEQYRRYSISLTDSLFCFGHGDERPNIEDDTWTIPQADTKPIYGVKNIAVSCMGGGGSSDHANSVATQAAVNANGSLPGYSYGDAVITFKDERSLQNMANLISAIFGPEIANESIFRSSVRLIMGSR